MLHAVGFAREDFKKSQIGIASTWSMVTPCNMHIDQLARQAEAGVNTAGAKAVIFNTITVSDGKYHKVDLKLVAAQDAATQARAREALARRAEVYRSTRGLEIPIAFLVGTGKKPDGHQVL